MLAITVAFNKMITNEADCQLPMIDFSMFPDNQISGLTLEEINDYITAATADDMPTAIQTVEHEGVADKMTNQSMEGTSYDSGKADHCTSKPIPSKSKSIRFQAVGDMEIEKVKDKSIPKGTKCRNLWAINLYTLWSSNRIISEDDENNITLPRSTDDLRAANLQELNYWLGKFVYEVRKKSGELYPRDTLLSLTAGINNHISQNRKVNLFKDDDFEDFGMYEVIVHWYWCEKKTGRNYFKK